MVRIKWIAALVLLQSCVFMGHAEVNWRLQIGGMVQNVWDLGAHYGGTELNHKISGNLGGGVFVQIPIKNKFFIETGLGYLYKPQLSVAEFFDFTPENYLDAIKHGHNPELDYGMVSVLEIPVKFGYIKSLTENSRLEFGVGPYLSSAIKYEYGDTWGVGLNVSATYRYKKMSYGLSWENPIFYNGPKDHYRNTVQLTIGFNFGLGGMRNWDWESIATIAGAIGESMENISNTYMELQNNSNDYNGYNSSNSSVSSSGGNSLNYQDLYNKWAHNAQRIIDGTDGHSMSASNIMERQRLLRDAQKEMKKIREKAKKAGIIIPVSPYESAVIRVN